MTEQKSKGRGHFSSRSTAISCGKDQGYIERRTKANNSIHSNIYVFTSGVTTVKRLQVLETFQIIFQDNYK